MQVRHNQDALVVFRKMGRAPRFPLFGSRRQIQKALLETVSVIYCHPYMSLTRTFLLGDICVQSIEGNHVDNVIALIEAKADINPQNVASARRGMPTHLYCVSVSLCVCRLRFLRCYELLQEDILIVSSHCSKPELT